MNLFELDKKYPNTGGEIPRSLKDLSAEEEKYYTEQKEIRRALGLPITKALVWYPFPYSKKPNPIPVISFNAYKFTNENGIVFDWCLIDVQIVGDDTPIKIHGDHFSEMQKKDFLGEINKSNISEIE